MLNLSAFNHNHHASRVKMVAKFIRRGIRVKVTINVIILKVDGDLADFGAPSTYFIFQEEKQ